MFKVGLVVLVFLGVLLIYLTNRHQQILSVPLHKNHQYLGYTFIFGGLLGWLSVLSGSAAFFIWFMITLNALMLLPLSCYLLTGRSAND